jgi:hypothetical protein
VTGAARKTPAARVVGHTARLGTARLDTALDPVMAVLLSARRNMREVLASRPSDAGRQKIARDRLLACLERYTAGLTARGRSAPPNLRDELALQRNLARTIDVGPTRPRGRLPLTERR